MGQMGLIGLIRLRRPKGPIGPISPICPIGPLTTNKTRYKACVPVRNDGQRSEILPVNFATVLCVHLCSLILALQEIDIQERNRCRLIDATFSNSQPWPAAVWASD